MLVEPQNDPQRLALDKAIADAVIARQAAGRRASPDADAIALRPLLKDLSPTQRAAVRAVMGRMEAGLGKPVVAHGGIAQLLAADRYGPFVRPAPDADHALQAAVEGSRALIDVGTKPWWGKLLAIQELKVIAALPDDAHARPRALIVSTEQPGPSGDDRTFWVTDSPATDDEIISALSVAGLAAGILSSCGGLKLFVLNGYVQPEDVRLVNAPGQISGVIGAAPVY